MLKVNKYGKKMFKSKMCCYNNGYKEPTREISNPPLRFVKLTVNFFLILKNIYIFDYLNE